MSKVNSLTPREIVEELDKYVVGQKEAKRSVAVALRNRYRQRRDCTEKYFDDRTNGGGQNRDCSQAG